MKGAKGRSKGGDVKGQITEGWLYKKAGDWDAVEEDLDRAAKIYLGLDRGGAFGCGGGWARRG